MKFLYYYISDYLKPDEIKNLNSRFNKKSEKFTKQAITLKTSKAVQMPYEELKKQPQGPSNEIAVGLKLAVTS